MGHTISFVREVYSKKKAKETAEVIISSKKNYVAYHYLLGLISKFQKKWSVKTEPFKYYKGFFDTFTESSGYLFELSSTEAESLTDYNISKIASIYRNKPFIVLRRLLQIGNTLGKWLVLRYIDSLSERSDTMFKVRASQLRAILVKLGPAYIKIAQAISSRPDLVPPSYLDELSLLQDRISPFSTQVAFNMIEKELGLPLDQLFSEISPEPMAAASLGQVYQARLRGSGQLVAVKVQRPGVQAAISLDILILRSLAGLIRRAGKFNTDLQGVVDEWASSLFREMDYVNEAKNGVRFRELYGGLKDVIVPDMYIERTSRKVLTMQWIEGQKLSEVKDLYLVEIGVYCSFNQLLECGFYHADPHPGNLLRTYDGKLAYLDFGMMGEFRQELRDGFIEACIHLINRDYDSLAKDFVTLGLLPSTADKDEVTKALTGVFQNAVAKGVQNISFGDLLGNLGTTMYKFKFQIPSYFSLVIRSLAVLEGIAINNDPNYKVLGGTYPWIAKKVLTDSSPQLRSSLQTLLYEDGVFRIDRLESLLSESLRARTEKALVKVEDNNSNVAIKQIMTFTLTEKGQKLSEVKDLYLVEIGVYCSFNQLLECGFYHADPHPGNLLRTYDGKLAYLDFGMMGEFRQELRDGFIEACIHLINRDYDSLAKDFVTLGLLPSTADKDEVTKALTAFFRVGVFQNAVAKGVQNISFGDLLGNLGTTMYKFKFQIPSYFSLVIRSLAVLEGIAINNDPNYKVLGGTYPWIAKKVLTDSSPQLRSSLQTLLYEDGVFRIDRLESLLSESLRARTEKALVKVEDNNSNVAIKQIMTFTLTEKGEFVREIILQEFAKGLDALGLATLESLTFGVTANLPFAPSPTSSLTNEDFINLRNLQRILQLLSGSRKINDDETGVEEYNPYANRKTNSEEVSLVLNEFGSIQDIQPLLNIIPELPPDLQQRLIGLPADLVGKLVSRIVARTVRRALL
ncbi:protein kinase superfamily protein [Artemisia annua]|uniref:Protein kinase superfamily protein n=1 Tax=Artemisia annua TaxID=35608 RepID=A0A2U1PVM4_ARTAN|nr:protein kinase superfamily protein [Artemisia annua]